MLYSLEAKSICCLRVTPNVPPKVDPSEPLLWRGHRTGWSSYKATLALHFPMQFDQKCGDPYTCGAVHHVRRARVLRIRNGPETETADKVVANKFVSESRALIVWRAASSRLSAILG